MGGGNDSLSFDFIAAGGGNLVGLAAGNDVVSGNNISSDSVYGGAGNDIIHLVSGSTSGKIWGGGDNDAIIFEGDIADDHSSTTVYGGLGADTFSGTNWTGGSAKETFVMGISSFADSVITAMDSVSLGSTVSGLYRNYYADGGLSLASFSAAGVSGTNGIATFSGTWDNGVTARYTAVDAAATTTGSVVAFVDGNNDAFLFIQGGSGNSDYIAKLSNGGSGIDGISLSDGKLITTELL